MLWTKKCDVNPSTSETSCRRGGGERGVWRRPPGAPVGDPALLLSRKFHWVTRFPAKTSDFFLIYHVPCTDAQRVCVRTPLAKGWFDKRTPLSLWSWRCLQFRDSGDDRHTAFSCSCPCRPCFQREEQISEKAKSGSLSPSCFGVLREGDLQGQGPCHLQADIGSVFLIRGRPKWNSPTRRAEEWMRCPRHEDGLVSGAAFNVSPRPALSPKALRGLLSR